MHDESFTAGKKIHKVAVQKQLAKQAANFLECLQKFAAKNHLPWFLDAPEEPKEPDEDLMQNLRGFISVSGAR